MKASVENFAQLNMPGKVLVLGDMLELGKDSLEEHKEVVKLAVEKGFGTIYLVGGEFAQAVADLQGELDSTGIALFEDSALLRDHFKEKPLSGCSVLIKGSRGKRLERIIEAL